MKNDRFELILGAALAALFVAFWMWQSPGDAGKLTPAEVDAYLRRIEAGLPGVPAERAEFLARMRAWGLADDGRPVYMLNAMRYYAELRRVPGTESVRGTPAEANAIYENAVMPVALRLGAFPLFGGDTMGVRVGSKSQSNLLGFDPAIDGWNRILVMRYPSRRAFFELVSDPEWLRFAPNKLAALEIALVPVVGQAVLPDLRWVLGGACLIVFFAVGWWRAKRSARSAAEAG